MSLVAERFALDKKHATGDSGKSVERSQLIAVGKFLFAQVG